MKLSRAFCGAAVAAFVTGPMIVGAALAADVEQSYDLSGFDRIDISGVYELDVRVGSDYSINLSGSEEEMSRVEVSVRDGVLYLSRAERRGRRIKKTEKGVEAKIMLPALASLEVSGVVEGEISGIDADRFDIDVSGVGDVTLDGECGDLDADVSGVGDLNARGLECRSVDIDVSGVGSATVFASEQVDASVSGMGSIDVYGSPSDVRKDGGMFSDITVH